MRTIAPALALLVGALSVLGADPVAAVERLSDEVRIAGRPLALSGRGNEAVLALLAEAERELAAGQPEQAVVTLERALRIEPRNPTIWHYLGLARLDTGDYAQAETMASRSHSLAPGDRALRARNARLVTTAREASGQPTGPLPEGLEMYAEETERQSVWSFLPSRSEPRRSRTVEPQAWRARETANDDRVRRDYEPLRQECRIWYPDRPPSRQPPPIACDEAPRQLPRGAVLLVSI
jgi:tetratricopeptide (TPR) repeat protein